MYSDRKDPHWVHLPAARGKTSPMPEVCEKDRKCFFKATRTKYRPSVFIRISESLRIPADAHSPAFSLCPNLGTVSQEKK